jgi:hypothetical protein
MTAVCLLVVAHFITISSLRKHGEDTSKDLFEHWGLIFIVEASVLFDGNQSFQSKHGRGES